VCDLSSNQIHLFLGNVQGTLAAPSDIDLAEPSQSPPSDVKLADVNHDNHLDLIAARSGSSTCPGIVSVWLGDGDGAFEYATNMATWTGSIGRLAVADLNSDSNVDIVVPNDGSTATVSTLLGHGDGTFDYALNFFTGSGPSVVFPDNFDGVYASRAATWGFGSVSNRLVPIQHEDRFDGLPEELGDPQRQRQAGIVLLGLDGVHGLPGDSEPLREHGLRPVAFGTQNFDSVFHS
jgi:hypothetical protein